MWPKSACRGWKIRPVFIYLCFSYTNPRKRCMPEKINMGNMTNIFVLMFMFVLSLYYKCMVKAPSSSDRHLEIICIECEHY